MHPFMAAELGHGFDLAAALRVGLVPLVVMAAAPDRTLRGYIDLYLQQEVKAEGLVRRLDDFSRFLEVASFSHAQLLNVAEIARECVASRNTVESYLGILEDLLIATRIPVFRRRAKRAVVAHGKFYFFDCGVFRSLRPADLRGIQDVPPRLPGGGAAVPGQRDPGAGRCAVHAGRPLPARVGAGPRPAALTAALGRAAVAAPQASATSKAVRGRSCGRASGVKSMMDAWCWPLLDRGRRLPQHVQRRRQVQRLPVPLGRGGVRADADAGCRQPRVGRRQRRPCPAWHWRLCRQRCAVRAQEPELPFRVSRNHPQAPFVQRSVVKPAR